MLSKKTVLVLGAGASMPYGLPSGLDLLRQIQRELSGSDFTSQLQNAGCGWDEIRELQQSLPRCGRSSIDAFLESRPDLVQVGKHAIAASLIPLEREKKLYAPEDPDDDWYRHLFTRLSDRVSASAFADHQLSIVTYNYDRSLDYFLFEAVRTSYRLSKDRAGELMLRIPVIHVHGRLGSLPWEPGICRGYGEQGTPAGLRACADQIQIIADTDLGGGAEYRAAREKLREAEVVCFLGFHYHGLNIERLRFEQWRQDAAIHGTAFGLEHVEVVEARMLLGNRLQIGGVQTKTRQFLRSVGPIV